ncbi:myocardin isoform X2 [Gouania willdenowi]|uniref:myocardin isoform X2 n=1 Tax=Gouania willdenowi TaxID=441366 RepID=UPI001054524D|nr:myocardin-like isoform X2 [Gouania willdenowi]
MKEIVINCTPSSPTSRTSLFNRKSTPVSPEGLASLSSSVIDGQKELHSLWWRDTRSFLFLSASLPLPPHALTSTMTLLASERSLFIRKKFRSVLQLRIQNRRLSEINADSGLKSTCPPSKGEKDQSEAQRLLDDSATQKLPPGGQSAETTQEMTVCGTQRHKKSHLKQNLNERIQHPSGASELQYEPTCPTSIALSADVLEDDIPSSSVSSPTKKCGAYHSLAFPSLPGLSGDQLLRDCASGGLSINSPHHAQAGLAMLPVTEGIRQPVSHTVDDANSMRTQQELYVSSQSHPQLPKTAQAASPTCNSSLGQTLTFNHLPRPRKPRDTKPKMRKLKYHQYIPPDQKTGSVTGGGGAKQKSSTSTQVPDPVISQPLKQQQVFLQLQIVQNQQQQQPQQQLTVVSSGDNGDLVKSAGEIPVNLQAVSSTTNVSLMDPSTAAKPEVLPANLADLTVSELRQQLRKRGLPVSGTKPALLQRLRPFQLPHACLTSAPLCHLGASPETLTLCPQLQPSHSPASSSTSALDSPNHSPIQQLYIQDGGIPNGALTIAPNGFAGAASLCVDGEQCDLTKAFFLAPASTASGTPSPSLPMSSSSPLQCGTHWRTESEQQDVSMEVEMRKRSRPKDRATHTSNEPLGGSLHPFLQQDPGCLRGKLETDAHTEVVFTQVFCCQPCDIISNDFELPVQITASPVESLPGIRSLEEELQEAIQKAQMDPRQSIDDILDDSITSPASDNVSDHKSLAHVTSDPSPPPPLQSELPHNKEDQFLSSPLCSSLLLELPPSPAIIHPNQVMPAPPPPTICTSPLSSSRKSRKRRAPSSFDAAEWLETLTSGLRPLTPPTAPFVESDFSLDSDLNVNRVLDLMIEQW